MAPPTEENVRIARRLCEEGSWRELLTFAQRWHEENPADHKALYYMGIGFSCTNQFSPAETAYRQALAIDASDTNVWNNLAAVLFENMRREAEAISCLEQALKINPLYKLGWSNLACMVGRLGRHDKALAYADRALALDPKLVEAYLHKGSAALALGKTDVVKAVCDALASIEPEKFCRAR